MNAQKEVAQLVAERGYRDGWTAEQFAARQVARLMEGLEELACNFFFPLASASSAAPGLCGCSVQNGSQAI